MIFNAALVSGGFCGQMGYDWFLSSDMFLRYSFHACCTVAIRSLYASFTLAVRFLYTSFTLAVRSLVSWQPGTGKMKRARTQVPDEYDQDTAA